jgi:hypothetical protein
VIATRRSSVFLCFERVNWCSHIPPPLSITHDRQGSPQVVWCLCMAWAPELGLASKTRQVGRSGDGHPSKRRTHTALVMQGGMPVARMTLYVSTGPVGHGQGTRNPLDVATSMGRAFLSCCWLWLERSISA